MTDNDGFREQAGTARWPRTPDDLTRTDRCPACFAQLATSVCASCGLDLTHPAARELLSVSTTVARDLDRRLQLIGRIRHDTAAVEALAAEKRWAVRARQVETDAAAPATAPPAVETVPVPAHATAADPVSGRARTPPTSPARPAGDSTVSVGDAGGRRPLSVQLVLLVIGVSLLSIGSIAFLVYAFVNYGIVWRSVIIGAVTIAAFIAASVLQRRALPSTAEGIAAFAVVLVYLDAYAIRANDLFGAASADPRVYWGVALVVASVGLVGWHRAAGLRVPSVAGFLGFAPGAGILAGGLTRGLDGVETGFPTLIAVALAGVLHRLVGRAGSPRVPGHTGRLERTVLLAISVAALALAALAAAGLQLGDGDPDATLPVLAFVGVGAVAVVHLGLLRSSPAVSWNTTRWATAVAVILGLVTAALGFAIVGNGGFGGSGTADGGESGGGSDAATSADGLLADTWQITPVVVAVIAALAFEALSRRASDSFLRVHGRPAAWTAAAVATVAVLIPLLAASGGLGLVIVRSLRSAWSVPPDGRIGGFGDDLEAVVALALVTVLAATAWGLTGVLLRRARLIGWAATTVLVLAVPVLDVVWAMLAAWFALAVITLTALVVTRRRTDSVVRVLRPPALGLLAAATIGGWTVGWSSTATWPIAAVLTIAIAIAARGLARSTAARAALLGAASMLLLVAAGTAARQITVYAGSDVWTDDPIRFAGLVAVVLLAVAASVTTTWISATDRRTMFWIAASIAVGSTLWVRFSDHPAPTILREPQTGLIADVLLLVGVLAWLVPAVTSAFPVERRAASVALAPIAWIAADAIALTGAGGAPAPVAEVARIIAPVIAALVVTIVSLAADPSASSAPSVDSTPTGVTRRSSTSATIPRNLREIGVVAVVASAVTGALVVDSDATRAALLIAAVTLLIVSVGQPDETVSAVLVGAATLLAMGAAAASALVPGPLADARPGQIAAILLLASSAFPLGRIAGALDRRTVFWLTVGAAAVTEASLRLSDRDALLLTTPALDLLGRFALLVGLLLWIALRSTAAFRRERIAASIAVGPAMYLVVESFARILDTPDFAGAVAPMTAALLTAAGSLVVALLRPRAARSRPFRELGVLLVALPAVIGALVSADGFDWLVLLLAGITALITAISADGLFSSRSSRRHLGWLAIALATAGLWLRLADAATSAVEPYVLPVSGVLLLVALLTWRAARRRAPEQQAEKRTATRSDARRPTTAASPLILLAGLLTAILPIAAYSATGTPLRAVLIGTASAVLLVSGSFAGRGRDAAAARPYLDAPALSGGIGVLVTAIGRASVMVIERPRSGELDAWILGGMTVLVAAGVGIASIPDDAFRRQRSLAGQAIALVALTAVLVIEAAAVVRVDAGILRPLGIVLLLSAVHVIAFLVDRSPFTRGVAWSSIGYALVIAAVGVATSALDAPEAGSTPIALALLATGVVHLHRTSAARSWRWLGPGVTLLLLPSLVATVDDRPLWRLVGLGVVGIAVVVVGAVRRLQAPFVIASVLLAVHAVATFAPQIRATYESVAWWLWLVIGGIILIALDARYEQRLKNLRDLADRVGNLR